MTATLTIGTKMDIQLVRNFSMVQSHTMDFLSLVQVSSSKRVHSSGGALAFTLAIILGGTPQVYSPTHG